MDLPCIIGLMFHFHLILSSNLAIFLRTIHIIWVILMGRFFTEYTVMFYTLFHVLTLCSQPKQVLSKSAKLAKIILIVLIVSSLQILKCYQDASPVIKYSYEIERYERFEISVGTVLLVDLNALIAVMWEFLDKYLQIRCFNRR